MTNDVMVITSKAEAARQDYQFDWSCWLPEGGDDSITASSWQVIPAGQLLVDSATFSATTSECFVTGGNPGSSYRIRNTITTAAGRIEVRPIVIGVYE